MSNVHAPYNFVPFSNKVMERYENEQELPSHEKIDPALKTGEIHIMMKADTPVYVSDGNGDFFRGANGKYQIPGSTIKGMIRENMQILGFGLVNPEEDMQDYQIYFRDMASSRDSQKSDTKKYYTATLDVKTERIDNKSLATPRNVKAGYICCEHGKYIIRPTKDEYLKVSRKCLSDKCGIDVSPAAYYAVEYTGESEGTVRQVRLAKDNKENGWKRGMLLSTGKPVGRYPNHLYIFPEMMTDEEAENQSIELSKEDVLSYREDWESRKNALKGFHYDIEFWNLPKEGERKAVFYVENIDGHAYFGMSLFLRIGYPHSLSEGLPDSHRTRAERENVFLDYAHAILGYANDKQAYSSRVQCEGLNVENGAIKYKPYRVILGEPRLSYYPGYLRKGTNYTQAEFALRGYKQYWLKEVTNQTLIENDKVATTLYPLDKETTFTGVIHYKNLTSDELGLLLWCLQLEKNCYQSIGMGKPYGLGRMKLRIDDLKEIKGEELYQISNMNGGFNSSLDKVGDYIQDYKKYISEKVMSNKKKKIESLNEISDFFFIHQIAPLDEQEMSYMTLKEYQNTTEPLITIEEVRDQQNKSSDKTDGKPQQKITSNGLDLTALSGNMRHKR